MEKNARASKKQRELLAFIDGFIKGYGYEPSYREIMRALGYKSVSTVAVHVDGLITRGYMRKTTNSARSLEIITMTTVKKDPPSAHEKWLLEKIDKKLAADDTSAGDKEILKSALQILGIEQEKA